MIMGELTLYALKSAICLAMLYLPYMLLMKRDTFHHLNRCLLIGIAVASLIIPIINIPLFDFSQITRLFAEPERAIVEVGLPMVATDLPTMHDEAAEFASASTAGFSWVALFVYIYIIGVAVCLLVRIIEIIRLYRYIQHGVLWTDHIDGINIYCHAGNVSSMSWLNTIVISESDYKSDPIVIQHERAHIRLHHSWDLLLLLPIEALQWFNPCVWMLKASLREVHEYEADASVMLSGVTIHDYQTLLIKKAISLNSYTFANGFNQCLLKKRFIMMKKKQSNAWSRMKVLYLLPVAAVAIAATATPKLMDDTTLAGVGAEAADSLQMLIDRLPGMTTDADGNLMIEGKKVERISINDSKVYDDNTKVYTRDGRKVTYILDGQRVTKAVYEAADKENEVVTQITELGVNITVYNAHSKRVAQTTDDEEQAATDDEVMQVCEVMPEFPGGQKELLDYMAQNIHYPKFAQELGVQGIVIISFVVDKEGQISKTEVIKHLQSANSRFAKDQTTADVAPQTQGEEGIDIEEQVALACATMEEEAMRVINDMPRWKPGTHHGKPVNVSYAIPINFRLK